MPARKQVYMYGLISLYLGFVIYLIIFFRSKKRDFLSKKVTIVLALKLVLLTVIYFYFFSEKMTKVERGKNLEKVILGMPE